MSSWTSHLPDDLKVKRLVGVGMNEEELRANPLLTERRVLDLNQEQVSHHPLVPHALGDGAGDLLVISH
jgi:hypothetical protein